MKWEDQWVTVEWQELKPGDIVKIHEKEEFPADMILLASSEEMGDCKVQTSNLDGEVNLKTKQALSQTMDLFEGETMKTGNFQIKATVNPPCYGLNTFSGNIHIDEPLWVDYRQLLLRVRFI